MNNEKYGLDNITCRQGFYRDQFTKIDTNMNSYPTTFERHDANFFAAYLLGIGPVFSILYQIVVLKTKNLWPVYDVIVMV